MSDGIYLALAGAKSQLEALDVVANNIANASTVGYRAERITFAATLSATRGASVAAERGTHDQRPGPVTTTGRSLDLAIDGEGGLHLQGSEEPVRSVSLSASADGHLVNAQGRALLDANGEPITIPADGGEVHIGEDGTVTAGGVAVGKAAIMGADGARIRSGILEGSNLGVVPGMIELVRVTRSFEALTRMIEQYKTIDERTAREIGSPR